jgi:hypothetical protein
MPGLIDRYSPMPAAARSQSTPGSKPRPVYLDATPAAAPRDTPVPRNKRAAPAAPVDDDDFDERPSRMPIVLAVVGVLGLGGLVMVAVAAVIAINVFGGGDDDAPAAQAAGSSRPAPQVQVRNNMTQKPGLIGVDSSQTPGPGPGPDPGPGPGPGSGTPLAPVPAPAEPAARPTAAAPPPAPAPVAPRRPAPAATQVASKGVLKIRSNRRVLVYVDGQAAGYTPLEVKVEPGDHQIVAMVPGQANTKQERDASVRSGGETVAVDFAF